MENVGAVTFTERFLWFDKTPTESEKVTFKNVILHELAHMWFGDLVTMKWWNDLWLNEAFATFTSFLAQHDDQELQKTNKGAWNIFNRYAYWGTQSDKLPSNHPIVKNCLHTDSAEDMFNGISYGKGSAFLKQFYHLIGKEVFS